MFVKTGKVIEYGWIPEAENIHRFEVRFPDGVSTSDRMAILKWLEKYQVQLQSHNPLWLVSTHFETDRYFLRLIKAKSFSEFMSSALQKMNHWDYAA